MVRGPLLALPAPETAHGAPDLPSAAARARQPSRTHAAISFMTGGSSAAAGRLPELNKRATSERLPQVCAGRLRKPDVTLGGAHAPACPEPPAIASRATQPCKASSAERRAVQRSADRSRCSARVSLCADAARVALPLSPPPPPPPRTWCGWRDENQTARWSESEHNLRSQPPRRRCGGRWGRELIPLLTLLISDS